MKVKEITKDYILFDNNKYLTYKITNPLKYTLYEYYFDFFSLVEINQTVSENVELKRIPYIKDGKFISSFDTIYTTNYSTKNLYSYNYKTSEFQIVDEQEIGYYGEDSHLIHNDLRNIGILFVEQLDIPKKGTYKKGSVEKTHFLPVYKKKIQLSDEQMNVLDKEIKQIEQYNKKYSSSYTLEDKIAGEIQIDVLYDDKIITTFKGIDFIELIGNYIRSDDEIHYDENCAFKIKDIFHNYIEFSNGKRLYCDIEMYTKFEKTQADFLQIDEKALEMTFYENELVFEQVPRRGFCFGNRGGEMIFVPCTRENGKSGGHADIYYDLKLVLHI